MTTTTPTAPAPLLVQIDPDIFIPARRARRASLLTRTIDRWARQRSTLRAAVRK